MFTPTSPIVGAAMTGFTSPTYTPTEDSRPADNAKQYAITTIGGTQTGVTANSVSSPFTLTVFRPKTIKVLGIPNPVTGRLANVPRNVYSILIRKGVTPLSGQSIVTATAKTVLEIPAGSDLADPANLKAMLSCLGGVLYAEAGDLFTLVTEGTL